MVVAAAVSEVEVGNRVVSWVEVHPVSQGANHVVVVAAAAAAAAVAEGGDSAVHLAVAQVAGSSFAPVCHQLQEHARSVRSSEVEHFLLEPLPSWVEMRFAVRTRHRGTHRQAVDCHRFQQVGWHLEEAASGRVHLGHPVHPVHLEVLGQGKAGLGLDHRRPRDKG